jgi:hypothetical protein
MSFKISKEKFDNTHLYLWVFTGNPSIDPLLYITTKETLRNRDFTEHLHLLPAEVDRAIPTEPQVLHAAVFWCLFTNRFCPVQIINIPG